MDSKIKFAVRIRPQLPHEELFNSVDPKNYKDKLVCYPDEDRIRIANPKDLDEELDGQYTFLNFKFDRLFTETYS